MAVRKTERFLFSYVKLNVGITRSTEGTSYVIDLYLYVTNLPDIFTVHTDTDDDDDDDETQTTLLDPQLSCDDTVTWTMPTAQVDLRPFSHLAFAFDHGPRTTPLSGADAC